VAGKKIYEAFGGRLRFFGVGGAKLNPTVEQFLLDAKISVCHRLRSYRDIAAAGRNKGRHMQAWQHRPAMQGVTLQIHNPDPVTGEGEVWARGENVMKGY
jgi:long-chain acyl-CoA synthetase